MQLIRQHNCYAWMSMRLRSSVGSAGAPPVQLAGAPQQGRPWDWRPSFMVAQAAQKLLSHIRGSLAAARLQNGGPRDGNGRGQAAAVTTHSGAGTGPYVCLQGHQGQLRSDRQGAPPATHSKSSRAYVMFCLVCWRPTVDSILALVGHTSTADSNRDWSDSLR
jgi:hypothetical protein